MPRITIRHRATAPGDQAEPVWRAQLDELGEILAQSAATRRPSRDDVREAIERETAGALGPRTVERLAARVAELLAA